MLDIKFIRENKEKAIISLKKKNCNIDLEKLISLDKKTEIDSIQRGIEGRTK